MKREKTILISNENEFYEWNSIPMTFSPENCPRNWGTFRYRNSGLKNFLKIISFTVFKWKPIEFDNNYTSAND